MRYASAAAVTALVAVSAPACTSAGHPAPPASHVTVTPPAAMAPAAVPPPAIEQVTGTVTGAPAHSIVTGKTPAVFPALTFSGVVATAAQNAQLGGHSTGSSHTFTTPRGTFTVRYTAAATRSGAKVPVTGSYGSSSSGPQCVFRQATAAGDYTVTGGTGEFAGASGHGGWGITYITANTTAQPGRPCDPAHPGPAVPSAAQVMFSASGPVTLPAGQ